MLRHSPSRSKEEDEGCERDDDDHDDDDNDKKIKMGSASSLLLLLSSQQLPSSSMSKSPRTRTNIQQQQRRRRRQIVLLLSVCSCLILIIMMTSFSKNHHHHHDVPQQSATTKNSLNLRSSSSSKSKPKVVLDREGNNINSPYYTDLDDTYHLETDPGEDYLLTHMNFSASINLEELIQGANEHEDKKVTLSTLVTIIGSGTAGLAAARQLQEEYGIYNYVIVEASSQSGGRVKKDTNFLDSGYPIDLGAAVVHRPDLIEDYANNRYQLQRNQQNNQRNNNQKERRQHFEYIRMPNGEVTFYNYSYYDWVMDYVAPQDHVTSTLYNCPVTSVTAYGNHVVTKCSTLQQQQLSGSVVYNIESRYVIMTASLQVLRDNTIQFIPPLPDTYIPQTHNKAVMWKGAKIFIEFSTNFYMGQAFCLFHCPVNVHRDGELEDGESFYWDHGIPGYNIITGFVMGEAYKDLEDLSDKDRIQVFLTKMDELFDGQASKYYIKHIFMDWTNEKYVKGTYSSMGLEGPHMIHGGQIILAGEAFPVTEDGQGWVHGALLSGETAADYVASHWKHIVKDCGSYGGCKLTNGRQRKKNLKRTNVAIEPTKNGLVYYDTTIRRRRERETTT